jgi:hypothetical protein
MLTVLTIVAILDDGLGSIIAKDSGAIIKLFDMAAAASQTRRSHRTNLTNRIGPISPSRTLK